MVNFADKKYIIWIILILSLSSFVFAQFPAEFPSKNNIILYYYPTNISTLVIDESPTGTQHNGTAVGGVTFETNGNIESNISLDGTNDYIDTGFGYINDTFTFSFWVKTTNAVNNKDILGHVDTGSANIITIRHNGAADNIETRFKGGATANTAAYTFTGAYAQSLNDGNWHYFVLVFNRTAGAGNKIKLYIDNNEETTRTLTNDAAPSFTAFGENYFIGVYNNVGSPLATYYFPGKLSNFLIYDKVINTNEIEKIYNLNRNYYIQNIEINNFIITPEIINENQDLTVSANVTAADYYNFTWYVNNAKILINSSTLSYENFSLGDDIIVELIAYNTIENQIYVENKSKTIGQTINFTSWDIRSNSAIENFSINYDEGTYTANGTILTIYNWNKTDEYFYSKENYQNSSVNLTTNINSQSYNFTVYASESVLFTIYVADIYTLLNTTNVVVTMFGSTFTDTVYNFTTSNGTIFSSNIMADKYYCEVSAEGFETNYFNLLILNKSYNTKNIYMVNTSETPIETTYTIIDTTTALQEDITIKVELYNGIEWIYAQECTTTSTGTCTMNFVQPKIVRYSLYDSSGNLIDFYSNEILDYTTRTFTIEEISPTFEKIDYYNYIKLNYYYSISPNPNTAFLLNSTTLNFTIRSQWNYPEVSEVCMRLKTTNVSIQYILFDDCINYNLQSQIYRYNQVLDNKSYIFETYIINLGQEQILDSVVIDFRRETTLFGSFGIFLGTIIIMFGAIAGALMGGIDGSIIGSLGALSLNTVIGFWPISYITLGGLIIFGIAFIVLRNR